MSTVFWVLRQWNKQTVVEFYSLILHNNYEVTEWLHKDLNDSEVLIVTCHFKVW